MKAVNLTPKEFRGSARSGGAAYGLLGALAVMVLLVGAYAMTGKSIRDTQAEIASVKAQADAAQAKTADLKPYGEFAALRKQRTDTVSQLATTRFDWAHVLEEVSRTIPADTSLSSLHGNADSSAGTGTPAPAATGTATTPEGPTVDIAGCTGGQAATARLMVALRRIDGVKDVTLSSSSQGTSSGSSSSSSTSKGSGTSGGDCTGKRTTFSMTLKYRAQAAATTTATPASTGSTP
jgi:Tfp pilus assembly protein PilN